MGKSVLMVVAQERFRDEEYEHPRTVFEKEGFDVYVAAPEKREATGMLGARVNPDYSIKDAVARKFDAIVVVGGSGAPQYLWNDKTLQTMLVTQHSSGKPLGAICLGPVVLANAGLLKGVEAAVYRSPDSVKAFEKCGAILSHEDVVVSGDIVTASGPAAARKFGRAVADILLK